MGNYDGGKLKAAQDAILDRLAQPTPPSATKELAEAFSLLENATKK